MSIERYSSGGVAVTWDSEKCTHAGRCVKGLPQVFDVSRKPWVDVDGATPEAIAAQVAKCPSGALGFSRDDASER